MNSEINSHSMNAEEPPQLILSGFTASEFISSEFGGRYRTILFGDIRDTTSGGGGGGGSLSSQFGLSTFASVTFAG